MIGYEIWWKLELFRINIGDVLMALLLIIFIIIVITIWTNFIISIFKKGDVSQEEWESAVTKAADDKVDLTFPQS